jgi:hypothetical protein
MNDLPMVAKVVLLGLVFGSIASLIYVGFKLREPGDDDDRDW